MPYLGGSGPGGSGSPYVRPPPPPPPPRAPVPRAPGQSGQVYTPPPAPRVNPARVNPTAPPTHTDITSSGAGYGSARANAYKASPAYKQTVAQVFRAQPPAQKAAIIRGLVHMPASPGFNPVNTPEFQAIRGQWGHLSIPEQNTIQALIPHDLPNFIAPKGGLDLNPLHLADQGLKALGSALSSAQSFGPQGPEGRLSQAGFTAPTLGRVVTHVPIDVARATLQDPSVIPKTLKGLGETVAGTVAGTVELPLRMVQQGPVKAVSQLGQQIGQDYSRRYGSLAAGNDQAFINRVKQEGAAPELFDAFAFAGGADATAGRAASAVARVKEATKGEANFLTRKRPDLLLSGNKIRPQHLAPTAGRATAQRLEDYLRSKRTGELSPRAGQLAPIFQSHAIRVVHSGIAQRWRRIVQENLAREVRGRPGSALAAIGKLSGLQKQAIYHAIHGIRVDTPANFRADLADRRAQILADRQNPASLGQRIPPQLADKVDEVRLIDRLAANAEKIAGPKLVAFQRGEATRAQRVEALTALHPATAEARRLRPIGDRLGVEHPDIATARQVEALRGREAQLARTIQNPGTVGELHAARAEMQRVQGSIRDLTNGTSRPEALAAYNRQVRAQMEQHGLPEPGYFKHSERPDVKYGDFTSGPGARAMPADKQSTFALHRAGIADHSPQAYLQGLARSVKRPLQWRLTDEQFRNAYLGTPLRSEIRAALGHNKAAHLLTGNELRRVLEHQGVDLSKVSFVNPGRLAEETLADHGLLPKGKNISEPNQLENQDFREALKQKDTVQHGDRNPSDTFLTTQGWKAVPRTAFDEIHGSLKGGTLGGRVFGKVQGTTAGLILNQNPHFLIMNTLAHAIPAVAGTKGRILGDLARFPVWWHGLSDAEKDTVRGFSGGRGGHYNVTAKLGSTAPNQIAAFGRKLDEQGIVQKVKAVNPLHAILKAEDIQSNFFRHAVMYHEIKRAAFQDMAHEYGRSVGLWEQVKHIFTRGPQDRMRAILQDMPRIEELGRSVVNVLGDYGRFTNRERQFLNNKAVLFYSFLRHVTRTLLYVLPARHPLAFGLMGELGNLHAEEVKKLMGGQDLPWAYGRIFFDGNNKLRSVDLTSTSPISSPLVDILSGGAKQGPRLISPALAPLLDVMYGQTPIGEPVQRNAWTYLNDLLSLSYPYRQGAAARFGLKAQQSDSIPFVHERPRAPKTAKAQQYQAAKEQARGPLKDYLLASALGLYPKPDDAQVIAQHMAAKAAGKKGAKSANWWSSGGGAKPGGAGNWWSSGGGSSGGGGSTGAAGEWWK